MNTRSRLIAMAFLTGLAILGTAVRAQAPAGAAPSKNYTKRTGFKLPVRIDARERSRLREILLFVKTGPTEPWTCNQSGPAGQTEFTFRAPQDGEYWFQVVTVDQTGRQVPADLNKENAGLVVVVDTQPPECELRPLTAATGEILFACDVRDANPDPGKIKLEYLAADKTWQVLEPHGSQPGTFRIPDPVVLKGPVRMTASDRSGNSTTREINLGALTALPAAPAASPQIWPATTDKTAPTAIPAAYAPAVIPAAVASPARAATPPLQLVNGKRVVLDYQVEALGPNGKIEVWLTRDEGQSWQRLCEDPDHHTPVEFDLPGEGLFGVALVVGSGADAVAPAKGENPDWWVEVDCTKPATQLLGVRPGASKEDTGTFLITWTASDKNLKYEPVDLYFASRKDGQWQPIAKGVKNNGNYRWTPPSGLTGDFNVRLEVSDRAGNVSRCEANQSGAMEAMRPRARVLGIATVAPRTTASAGN